MGNKILCNPVKLTSIVSYLQKSRVAHNIRDLEKHLPAVASINGMQVKEYLQSLADENRVHVEKIGSGNWYWSFASEEKRQRTRALAEAETAYEKASASVEELKARVAEMQAQADDDDCDDRAGLSACKQTLEARVRVLQKELAVYADTDPAELEAKEKEVQRFKVEVEQYTDEIYAMEGWFRKMGMDEEGMKVLKENLYEGEYDEEEGGLREL